MIRGLRHTLIITSLGCATAALPAPDEPASMADAPSDPVLEQVGAAIATSDFARAADILRGALAKDSGNASYHNMYAYAIRKGPNPNMDLVFKHYNEALRIEPKHRGAHEYVGEAYLMVGNVAKAKEHLGVLDRLCTFGCEEHSKLKKAVADYEQSQAKR